MIQKTKLSHFLDNLISNLYRYLLPAVTIFSLLILAQVTSRPRLAGSGFLDFLVRIMACLWLCITYARLPYLSIKYRPFPGSTSTKADVSSREKVKYICEAIVFGVFFAIMTWGIIDIFLPVFRPIIYLIAVINGLLFSIPLIAQYEVFKQ